MLQSGQLQGTLESSQPTGKDNLPEHLSIWLKKKLVAKKNWAETPHHS